MDGYLEREHIPTSSGRRGRAERSIAVPQVHELQMLYLEPDTPPVIDFAADAEIVRTVVEGERLTYGYLFNPAFATAHGSRELAHAYALAHIAEGAAEQHRERLHQSLPERTTFIGDSALYLSVREWYTTQR